MNIQDRMDLKKAKNVLIQSNDPRFNFAVAPVDVIDDFPKIPEIIPMEKYDYGFKKDDGDETRLPELSKLSMLTSCSSLEDLECWYREKHPNLPDEFHGVMARYSAGQPITKKEAKQKVKKIKNKPKKELPVGFTVARGPVVVKFD
tara:strand:+ start:258 stop:695 length:438 start_codon:yes stop_codon:yes gene_type:complete